MAVNRNVTLTENIAIFNALIQAINPGNPPITEENLDAATKAYTDQNNLPNDTSLANIILHATGQVAARGAAPAATVGTHSVTVRKLAEDSFLKHVEDKWEITDSRNGSKAVVSENLVDGLSARGQFARLGIGEAEQKHIRELEVGGTSLSVAAQNGPVVLAPLELQVKVSETGDHYTIKGPDTAGGEIRVSNVAGMEEMAAELRRRGVSQDQIDAVARLPGGATENLIGDCGIEGGAAPLRQTFQHSAAPETVITPAKPHREITEIKDTPADSYPLRQQTPPYRFSQLTKEAQQKMLELEELGVVDIDLKTPNDKCGDDGFFGPLTEAAVRKTQEALGMKPDGIITKEFVDKMDAKIQELKQAGPKQKTDRKEESPDNRDERPLLDSNGNPLIHVKMEFDTPADLTYLNAYGQDQIVSSDVFNGKEVAISDQGDTYDISVDGMTYRGIAKDDLPPSMQEKIAQQFVELENASRVGSTAAPAAAPSHS